MFVFVLRLKLSTFSCRNPTQALVILYPYVVKFRCDDIGRFITYQVDFWNAKYKQVIRMAGVNSLARDFQTDGEMKLSGLRQQSK